MQRLRLQLLRLAIGMALRKPCSDRIPRSGEAGQAVDCMFVKLRSEDGTTDIAVDRMNHEGISGKAWNGTQYHEPIVLTNSELSNLNLMVERYYGLFGFTYDTPTEVLISEYLLRPQRILIRDRLAQWLFNRKTPTRTSRIDALKMLIDVRSDTGRQGFGNPPGLSEIGLLERAYGGRIFRRHDYFKFYNEFRLILESLVASGDADLREGSYSAKGKALHTIAEYEEQNRRHGEQVRQTWVMIFLTAIVAAATALQAYTATLKPGSGYEAPASQTEVHPQLNSRLPAGGGR